METTSEKNKRIAKNTLLLYFRMLIVMAVSLYTSRLVLQALGVVDYGIYSVVGGIVSLCSVFSASISSAISRFLTIELGRENNVRLRQVFSASTTILLILCVAIVIIAEPIGLWFVSHKMVIPAERLTAAYWIFHLSLLTFCINLIAAPYNACIIAHERMGVFAYISIVDIMAKLLVVAILFIVPVDKLIIYGVLMALVAVMMRYIYGHYCVKHFQECKYSYSYDKTLFKEIFSFAGWNFIGSTAAVIRDQGGNILMNLFGGPAVNAARGISIQVNHAVAQFANNFMTAMNPQIIKSYATEDFKYLYTLIFRGSRFSFYLLLILSLPLLICTGYVLDFWLVEVPHYAVEFVRLSLFVSMIDALTNSLTTSILATGKVKYYQIAVGGTLLLNIPISYVFLRLGMSPVVVLWVSLSISFVCMVFRILFVQRLLGIRIMDFVKDVCFNCLAVGLLSIILPFVVYRLIGCDNFIEFAILCLVCVVCSMFASFFVGCKKSERSMLIDKVKAIVAKMPWKK